MVGADGGEGAFDAGSPPGDARGEPGEVVPERSGKRRATVSAARAACESSQFGRRSTLPKGVMRKGGARLVFTQRADAEDDIRGRLGRRTAGRSDPPRGVAAVETGRMRFANQAINSRISPFGGYN